MVPEEPHDLTADLQPRHVRVQVQPIDTLDLERHMTLEHVVDVRHARHRPIVNAEGGLCPPGRPALDGGGREGGLPPPANALVPETSSVRKGAETAASVYLQQSQSTPSGCQRPLLWNGTSAPRGPRDAGTGTTPFVPNQQSRPRQTARRDCRK